LAAALILAALSACKDAPPVIRDVQFKAVFDYGGPGQKPTVQALLFVQPDTDVTLTDRIQLRELATGYVWTIEDPAVLEKSGKAWAGGVRLARPGGAFRNGEYLVRYIDTAERESELVVTLAYPAELPGLTADGAAKIADTGYTASVALYDGEENLMYFDKKRDRWTEDAAILADYPNAVFSRECLSGPGYSADIMLPLKTLEGRQ
jgi:hypothetical protein